MKKFIFAVLFFIVACELAGLVSAQSKARKTKRTTANAAAKKTPAAKMTGNDSIPSAASDAEEIPVKKNERPATNDDGNRPADGADSFETGDKIAPVKKSNERSDAKKTAAAPVYFYTFSQPDFLVSKIFIEHDETGAGKITFQKRDFGDLIADPIQLSPAALQRVKAAFDNLNFLESNEVYQSRDKNYAHLGTMTFAEKKNGRERKVEFNWTENKDAKALADEYRKIGQQFVWIFDINVARQNQPLETPSLVDTLDALIKRGEISDAAQLLPFLKELSEDERLPLLARNHTLRIIKAVEKTAAKK